MSNDLSEVTEREAQLNATVERIEFLEDRAEFNEDEWEVVYELTREEVDRYDLEKTYKEDHWDRGTFDYNWDTSTDDWNTVTITDHMATFLGELLLVKELQGKRGEYKKYERVLQKKYEEEHPGPGLASQEGYDFEYIDLLDGLLAGAEFDHHTGTVTIEYEIPSFAWRVAKLKDMRGEADAAKYWTMQRQHEFISE